MKNKKIEGAKHSNLNLFKNHARLKATARKTLTRHQLCRPLVLVLVRTTQLNKMIKSLIQILHKHE